MTRPTQGTGGPDGRPLCFNGTAPTHYVANDGYTEDGRLRTVTIPWAFSTECKSWAGHPGSDPVPLMEGWLCKGCRWEPLLDVHKARKAQEARA
jgi:hypothetical protein